MSQSLLDHFQTLPDPRVDRTKIYPLLEIILLIIAGTISGCEGWKQIKDFGEMKLDWLRKFLPYAHGIPVDDTLARVMRKLDTKAFQTHFLTWMRAVSEATEGKVISIDGKTLRRSYNRRDGKGALHLISAWCSENGLVLGQEKTNEKSNEITAIPELLNVLELKGCIVTIDAMGCQKSIAEQIVSKKADYVLALKGNQGQLHSEVKEFFELAYASGFKGVEIEQYEESDKGHGRIEHRQCFVVKANTRWFPSSQQWPHLKQIVMVKSRRELQDKMTEDTRYYITSTNASAQKLLAITRAHWGIENSLHWTLDVTFREDESRIRAEASPENFAIIRHIALNLLKKDTSIKASVKRKRLMAALNDEFRERLIREAI